MSSLKVTVAILVAFLILTFWGTLAQANAEAAGLSASFAADRFFDSYFIWVLGVVPLPAFKCVALFACVNLVASMIFRIPRGWKNAGLFLMHTALLVLLVGSLVGSAVKSEYNGYGVAEHGQTVQNLKFFVVDDSLGLNPVDGIPAQGGWPYYVQYRGNVEMSPGRSVEMYKA